MLTTVIMKYILLYFIIISGSISIAYKFKKKVCETLPISFFLIMIILYISGLFQGLRIGVYIIEFLYPILFFICIINAIHKKEIKSFFKTYILNYDLLIFTILFSVFGASTYNRIFTACDDYGYWSMAAKNMYYLDDFVTNPNSIIRLIYPPFPTILQYFFEKIIGENRQGIELFATVLFGLTLLLPLLKNIKSKYKTAYLCMFFVILSIPAIFIESWFYLTIYVDSLLGLLIGYILFEYYTEDKDSFYIISLGLSMAVLTLIKPTGVFIALIILGIFALNHIINNFNKNLKKFIKNIFNFKNLKIIIILFVVVISVFLSWEIYKNKTCLKNGNERQSFSVKYVFETMYDAIVGNSKNTEDVMSWVNLPNDLFDKTTYSSKPFGMSAGTWLCIFAIASIAINKFALKNGNKKFIIYVGSIFVGAFVYISFLQVAYIIEFPNAEAINHASLERYLGTFLIAMLITIIGIFIDYCNKKEVYNRSTYVFILALVLIFTPVASISNLTISSGTINSAIKSNAQKMIERKRKSF